MSFPIICEESLLIKQKFLLYGVTFLFTSFLISKLKMTHLEFKIEDISVISCIAVILKLNSYSLKSLTKKINK